VEISSHHVVYDSRSSIELSRQLAYSDFPEAIFVDFLTLANVVFSAKKKAKTPK